VVGTGLEVRNYGWKPLPLEKYIFINILFSGRKNNGTAPSHFVRSSSSIARNVLKSLENLKLAEKDANG
jgi:ribosomal protein S19E (S16A)